MKKLFFYATSAAMILASCSSDDFVGENNGSPGGNVEAITFGSGVPATTRADATGATAAGKLNSVFYVYGIKNETTDGAAAGDGNLVYNNYKVTYSASTAFTTTSNTENWEYVGNSLTAGQDAANISPAGNGAGVAQTIKYWDWEATNYVFYAFSAKPADLQNGYVQVAKTTSGTTVYDKGYSVTLTATADLDNLYFSERLPIAKSNDNTDRVEHNKYGGQVRFRFHNVGTKVRVAMYETIPGYSVKINSFKTQDSDEPTFAGMTTPSDTYFKANFVNNSSGTAGEMIVRYNDDGPTLNYPTVTFTPTGTAANVLTLGPGIISATSLATTSTGATYDKAARAYTTVFPKEDNTQNLKLKVCYTLTAPTTGERITVTDATAEIPAEYLKWKPGYAYTYIFKISDNTNGSTGTPSTDPAGLYPITFDAVVAESTDGIQETITTVSEPTITTFGISGSKYTSGTVDEYPAGSDIYAVIMAGSSVVTPVLTGPDPTPNVKIYSVTTSDATNFPITEASVAESLGQTPAGTSKITATDVTGVTEVSSETIFTAAPAAVTSVPGEDGNNKTINAVKLTGVAAGTYAIEYTATSAWTGSYTKIYKIIKVVAGL